MAIKLRELGINSVAVYSYDVNTENYPPGIDN